MTAEKMNVAECKNSKKYCHKSISIGICNILKSSTGIGIGKHLLPKYCYCY